MLFHQADYFTSSADFLFCPYRHFFVNKLLLSKLISERVNPHFESIFAIGVDEMSWDDLDEVHYDWPTVQEVRDYRHQVRALILNILEHAPLTLPLNWQNPWWTIIMGIEHERIHLETSSVLIRQHALEHVRQHPQWRANIITGMAPDNILLDVPEGKVHLQKDFNHPFYGWDNEYGRHEAEVAALQPPNIWYRIRNFWPLSKLMAIRPNTTGVKKV